MYQYAKAHPGARRAADSSERDVPDPSRKAHSALRLRGLGLADQMAALSPNSNAQTMTHRERRHELLAAAQLAYKAMERAKASDNPDEVKAAAQLILEQAELVLDKTDLERGEAVNLRALIIKLDEQGARAMFSLLSAMQRSMRETAEAILSNARG